MRWFFALLVLANLGLLMWATWYRNGAGEAATPRPVFHPELMVPLNAAGVNLRARKSDRVETPLAATKLRQRCVSIGGFVAPSKADRAAALLVEEKLSAIRRSVENRSENSYWVHLAGFANRKQAEKRLKELERLGVRDLLIMQAANGQPAISLGLFSQSENAQKRMQELAQKGITAQQEIRFRTENVNWFDLRLPEPADAQLEHLRAINWDAPGVEVREMPCLAESASPR